MRFAMKFLLVMLLPAFMWGCSSHQPKAGLDKGTYAEIGKASFYANKHQSKKTASGEIYYHNLSTAAHKTLPLGVKVKVTNIENGKTVVVKVNDRGPYVKGRIIDLSLSAFSSIASTSSGVIEVKVELIE